MPRLRELQPGTVFRVSQCESDRGAVGFVPAEYLETCGDRVLGIALHGAGRYQKFAAFTIDRAVEIIEGGITFEGIDT